MPNNSFPQQHTPPQPTRLLVNDNQLEAAVLKKLLNANCNRDEAIQLLSPDCFYKQSYRQIFLAILSLYNQGAQITALSVSEELFKTMPQDEVGNQIAEVFSIDLQHEEMMEMDHMLRLLREFSKRRQLTPLAQELLELSYSLQVPFESIHELMTKVDGVVNETEQRHFSTLSEQLEVVRQHILDNDHPETRHSGILTSIPLLDQNGGLPPGLVVVAGKSSHGKTSFANFLALNAMRSGASVAYYSMEMDNLQLSQRLVAMESRVNANHIAHHPLTDEQKTKVDRAIERLNGAHAASFNFDERGITNLDRMMQSVRSLKRSRGLDLVVVDYIQLLGIEREYRDENTAKLIGRAAHEMHNVGLQLGITFLCLSQLNRNVTGIPTRAHIRDSGEIDEAADATILIYRGAGDKLDAYPSPFEHISVINTVLVLLDKHRNGATGHCVMGFNPELTLYSVLAELPTVARSLPSKSPSTPTQYSLEWVKGSEE